MTSPDLPSRVLALALGRGLATEAQLQAPGPPPSNPEAAWGGKIQILIDRGQLAPDVAELLLWEASQDGPEGPSAPLPVAPDSWLDSGEGLEECCTDPGLETLAWERYSEVSLIAAGGAGMVFKAYDPRLARQVALKVLKRMSAESAARLLKEAQAQAGVEHPNVCKIYEVGENQGHAFIAMQLVIGKSLAEAMGDLSVREKVSVMREVAEGVHAAHRRGLVHLDLKPGNVLLEFLENGEVHPYVTDFGLVKQEGSPGRPLGAAEGTPPFASPEQVRGQRELLDRRSDVYSLGVTLFVLLNGKFPFLETTQEGMVRATLEDSPLPLSAVGGPLPKDLDWITRKAMRKDPGQRYPTAMALAEDLQRFLEGQTVTARPRTLAYRAATWLRRSRVASLSLAAGLLLGLAAMGLGLRAAWWARHEGELAQRFEQIVDRADATVRQDAMLPPHDIRRARTHFWEQVATVRTEMGQGGSVRLLGHYALGRAELLHGDPAKALEHLESAWGAGLRTPVVQAALGEAKLNRYFSAREEAERLQDPKLRGKLQSELEERLRNGGLAMLREVDRKLGGPQRAGVEIRLAVYEGRWEEALRRVKELQRSTPWVYDAWVQEGCAHHAFATAARKAGRLEVALQALEKAEDALVETSWRFPSAVDSLRLQSEIWRMRAEIMNQAEKDPFQALEKAVERLDRCLVLDPDHAFDGEYRARLLLAEAIYLERAGRENGRVLAALDQLTAKEIRRLGVRNAAALLDLRVKGLICLSRSEKSPVAGRAAIVSAIDSVQEAIRDSPKEKAPHALLVLVLRHLVEFSPGWDPNLSWALGRAGEAYETALAMDSRTPARTEMALLLALSAEKRGDAGAVDLERAKACLAEAPREAVPSLEALARARISRVEALQDPSRRDALMERARGHLTSTRPGMEELPFFLREARALGIDLASYQGQPKATANRRRSRGRTTG